MPRNFALPESAYMGSIDKYISGGESLGKILSNSANDNKNHASQYRLSEIVEITFKWKIILTESLPASSSRIVRFLESFIAAGGSSHTSGRLLIEDLVSNKYFNLLAADSLLLEVSKNDTTLSDSIRKRLRNSGRQQTPPAILYVYAKADKNVDQPPHISSVRFANK